MNISGADVRDAESAWKFLALIATAFTKSAQNTDTFIGNQIRDGVSGTAIVLLTLMRDKATVTAGIFAQAAARAEQHYYQLQNQLGSRPSIAGTQTGYAATNGGNGQLAINA